MDYALPRKHGWPKVAKDPEGFGAVQHPLDQTVFVFYAQANARSTTASVVGSQEPPPRRFIRAFGVYVDVFWFVQSDDPER
eukprot:8109355-Lingulodinium_polyedra.AAC.1